MPLSIADLVAGVLVPIVVSALVMLVGRRCADTDAGRNMLSSIAFTSAYLVGHSLVGLSPPIPESHWHWVPYVVVAAGVVGVALAIVPQSWTLRRVCYVVSTFAAALVLVPTWTDLNPSRGTYVLSWTLFVAALALLFEKTAERVPIGTLTVATTATFLATATLLVLSGNLRFAQMALAGFGAWLGMSIRSALTRAPIGLRGTGWIGTMLMASVLLVGQVNSFSGIPWAFYALLPLAPLLSGVTASSYLSRMGDRAKSFVQVLLPICWSFAILFGAWLYSYE